MPPWKTRRRRPLGTTHALQCPWVRAKDRPEAGAARTPLAGAARLRTHRSIRAIQRVAARDHDQLAPRLWRHVPCVRREPALGLDGRRELHLLGRARRGVERSPAYAP